MEKLCMVYVTTSGKDEAVKIAENVVTAKLAACANVYDGVTSFYLWEGEEEKTTEATLVLKTKEALLSELRDAIKELHSYSCPCIVAIPLVFADEPFAKWIIDQTK